MSDFSWDDPHAFLGLGAEFAARDRARVALLPVPYEATTSYMEGTRGGPGELFTGPGGPFTWRGEPIVRPGGPSLGSCEWPSRRDGPPSGMGKE